MDGDDDQVELGERAIVEVERAILEDVHLGTLQDAEAAGALLGGIDLREIAGESRPASGRRPPGRPACDR